MYYGLEVTCTTLLVT